jgi:hypothetical protein
MAYRQRKKKVKPRNKMLPPPSEEFWLSFWQTFDRLEADLRDVGSININSTEFRENIKSFIQYYFRHLRPELERLGITSEYLGQLDDASHRFLELANGRNPKEYYARVFRDLGRFRPTIELNRELQIGRITPVIGQSGRINSGIEDALYRTLLGIIPTAAKSYEQAIIDLSDGRRVSFRGTVMELREALREVLDHLAPDAEVMKVEGYKLEKDHTKPTMKQKVVFILRSRGKSRSSIEVPKDSTEIIDLSIGSLARSIYDRGSMDGHLSATRAEAAQLKLYVESVLSELLEIHR